MDRTAMQGMVQAIAKIGTHDITVADLDLFLDEGYQEVCSVQAWPWGYQATPDSIAMIAGTTEYAVAAAAMKILSVVNTTENYPLRNIGQSEMLKLRNQPTGSTMPRWYTFIDGNLTVWPAPSATDNVDVYYYEHPAFAAAGGSTPVFDVAFHTILVDWCLSRVWEVEEDFTKADDYRARFEIKLNRMRRFYNTENQDAPLIYGGGKHRYGFSHIPDFITS